MKAKTPRGRTSRRRCRRIGRVASRLATQSVVLSYTLRMGSNHQVQPGGRWERSPPSKINGVITVERRRITGGPIQV